VIPPAVLHFFDAATATSIAASSPFFAPVILAALIAAMTPLLAFLNK